MINTKLRPPRLRVGQGVANIASGLFRGTVVAGSLSATALVVSAGARSRLANISAGVVMALAIIFFARFVGAISMPALAGLDPYVLTQMERTGTLKTIGRHNVFPASEGIGEALLQAVEAAEEWIAGQSKKPAE